MKETKFRILELPTHQVLLTKDFGDGEESSPLLVVTFFFEDTAKINQKLTYSDEEKRDRIFDEFTQETAQSMVDSITEMFKT